LPRLEAQQQHTLSTNAIMKTFLYQYIGGRDRVCKEKKKCAGKQLLSLKTQTVSMPDVIFLMPVTCSSKVLMSPSKMGKKTTHTLSNTLQLGYGQFVNYVNLLCQSVLARRFETSLLSKMLCIDWHLLFCTTVCVNEPGIISKPVPINNIGPTLDYILWKIHMHTHTHTHHINEDKTMIDAIINCSTEPKHTI
jgi:hypothetical protein